MPNEPRVEGSPCAALQVLGGRVGELERRFEEHNRIQNGHLASIGGKLADLSKANTDGREERSKQIGDLRADIVERFNRILLTAIVFGLSLVAGLLYTILR